MHLRSVVRQVTPTNLTEDIAKLNGYTHLDLLHPELKPQLEKIQSEHPNEGFYGLPYSVHYHSEIQQAYKHLNNAADAIENDDKEFARYLRQRGFDLYAMTMKLVMRHGLPVALIILMPKLVVMKLMMTVCLGLKVFSV